MKAWIPWTANEVEPLVRLAAIACGLLFAFVVPDSFLDERFAAILEQNGPRLELRRTTRHRAWSTEITT